MDKELVVKIILIFVSGAATVFFGLCLWGLKILIESVYNATVEIKLVNKTLSALVEDVKAIPEMRKDIDGIGHKVRGLEKKD